MELNELRKTAEAATPGPWDAKPYLYGVDDDGRIRVTSPSDRGSYNLAENVLPNDATHIATFNPETVLALLSRVEKAERSCRLLGTIIERDGKNLVELTNSQDIIPEDGDGDWEVVWERAQEMKARLEQAEQAVQRVREMSAHRKEIRLDYVDLIDLDRALDGDGRG